MSACNVPPAAPAPSMRRGSFVRTPLPIASARRRAGSIVTTTAARPDSAACSASAADVVVLPTPPVPAHTTMWLRARTSSTDASAMRRPLVRECEERGGQVRRESRRARGIAAVVEQIGERKLLERQLAAQSIDVQLLELGAMKAERRRVAQRVLHRGVVV